MAFQNTYIIVKNVYCYIYFKNALVMKAKRYKLMSTKLAIKLKVKYTNVLLIFFICVKIAFTFYTLFYIVIGKCLNYPHCRAIFSHYEK